MKCQLALLLFVLMQSSLEAKSSNRIVGGKNAPENAFPWMVQLRLNYGEADQSFCSGTLIEIQPGTSTDLVLTAAHCMFTNRLKKIISPKKMLATVGAHRTQGKAEQWERSVSVDAYIYGSFSFDNMRNDVAVLKLRQRVFYNENVRPVPLANIENGSPFNKTCLAIGWGETESQSFSETLKMVALQLVSGEKCTFQGVNVFDSKSMLCAIGTGNGKEGTCIGDSGGALVCVVQKSLVQFGITSWGVQCGIMSVFTAIQSQFAWIKSAVDELNSGNSYSTMNLVTSSMFPEVMPNFIRMPSQNYGMYPRWPLYSQYRFWPQIG